MDFIQFKQAVAKQFDRMRKHDLFVTQVEKDDLWATYLNSFPEGTNPIYRERTEHDCSCCRQFIRAVGNVVAIINGELVSIWDIEGPVHPAYRTVADALSALVHSKPIDNFFLTTERTAGQDKNFEQMVDRVQTWEHFFVNIPSQFVMRGEQIGPTHRNAKLPFLASWGMKPDIWIDDQPHFILLDADGANKEELGPHK